MLQLLQRRKNSKLLACPVIFSQRMFLRWWKLKCFGQMLTIMLTLVSLLISPSLLSTTNYCGINTAQHFIRAKFVKLGQAQLDTPAPAQVEITQYILLIGRLHGPTVIWHFPLGEFDPVTLYTFVGSNKFLRIPGSIDRGAHYPGNKENERNKDRFIPIPGNQKHWLSAYGFTLLVARV